MASHVVPLLAAGASMFHVGSPSDPAIARGPVGPLWAQSPASVPGRAAHGTFGEIYVAEQLALQASGGARDAMAGVGAASDASAVATREATGVLTTAQATLELPVVCQRLIKRKASRLRRADRRRRARCLSKRRVLVAASVAAAKKPPASTAPATAPAAPAAPVQGPAPVPSPTPVGASAAPTPTPTPTKPPIDPSTVICSAVGVTAIDIQPFELTRGVACVSDTTGTVTFELTNRDSQVHGIMLRAVGASASTPPTIIVGSLGAHSGPVSASVKLAPGNYTLMCTITSHNPAMQVPLKILTKADYIAQGYAG